MKHYRIDASIETELSPLAESADGAIHTQAIVARAGIYGYRRKDGTVKRELVLPEHLFAPESLSTLANVALTLEHPPEFLTPQNARQFSVGHVHETVDAVDAPEGSPDFAYARVRLTARTRDAVERLKSKRKMFTSPGYSLPEYQDSPGIHPIWGAYDAIQGPRIYNHLALTDYPRGGANMLVRMDSDSDPETEVAVQERTDPASWVKDDPLWEKAKKAAAEQGKGSDYAYITGIYKAMGGRIDALPSDQAAQSGETKMEIVRVDGVDYSLEPAQAAVLKAYMKKRDADVAAEEQKAMSALDKLAELQKQVMDLTGRINMAVKAQEEAEGKAEAASAEMMDAKKTVDSLKAELADPAKLRERLAPRLALESQARQVLPKDRHDSLLAMTDRDIRVAMIKTYQPNAQLENRSDDYLSGMLSVVGVSANAQRPPAAGKKAGERKDFDPPAVINSVLDVYAARRGNAAVKA